MSKAETSFERLELKYCEHCGGLWIRRKGSEQVFCSPCAPLMAELPPPRRKNETRLPVAQPEIEIEGSVIELMAVAEEARP